MKAILFSFFLALFALPLANAETHELPKPETDIHHFDENGDYIGSTHVDDGFDCDFVNVDGNIIYWHGEDC